MCLSTDIENYTATSQGMKPRDLASLMERYYRTLGTPATEHGGRCSGAPATVRCVSGPASAGPCSSLWPPRRRDQGVTQRRKACRAALEMRHVIERFNSRHSAQPLPTRVRLHAGVNSPWERLVANTNVIGDTANAASRNSKASTNTG